MDDVVIDGSEEPGLLHSQKFKNLVASSVPSLIMRPILQPLEILKIRLQLLRTQSTPTIVQAIKVICNEEGWPVLFRGLQYAQFVSVTTSIFQFTTFRNFRQTLHQTPLGEAPQTCDFIAGFLMGGMSAFLFNPFDIVRTILFARKKEDEYGVFEIVKRLYGNGKIREFYTGASAGIWHIGILNGLRFMFYNAFCSLVLKFKGIHTHKQMNPMELFSAGLAAAYMSNFAAYPLELIKKRLQIDKTQFSIGAKATSPMKVAHKDLCLAAIQCAMNVAKNEGIGAFYKGFLPNAAKSIISTAIQFSFYDIIYNAVDDFVKKIPK